MENYNPIGILGIGQAGGNLAREAAKAGFAAAALNTSQEDLAAISQDVKHLYHAPGELGAGKDRSVGKRVVTERWQEMVDFVTKVFGGTKVKALGVSYSLGGGTGSSVGPVLGDVLTEALPDTTIFFLPILPHSKESPSAQVNALEALGELSAIERVGASLIIDNNQGLKLFPHASKGELYAQVNQGIIKQLLYLVRLTAEASDVGNFDARDLLQVLSTRGFALIGQATASATVRDLAEARLAIARQVRSSWEQGLYAPVEYQGSGPVRAAMLYQGPEGLTRFLDPATIFRELGEPFELFDGAYSSTGDGVITSVLAGLPWPSARLQAIEDELASRRSVIESQMENAATARFASKVASWGLKKPSAASVGKPTDGQASSILEKLKKYGSR